MNVKNLCKGLQFATFYYVFLSLRAFKCKHMIRLLMINFCFLSCLSALAQSNKNASEKNKETRTASPNAPMVVENAIPEEAMFLQENVYDFGKIPQGKPVTHTFEFVNKGKLPFSLNNVQASCGCTTPVWNKDIIQPGDTGKIEVGYNSAAEGVFDRSISIVYNNGLTREIHIKGEVWKTPVSPAPENNLIKVLKNQK